MVVHYVEMDNVRAGGMTLVISSPSGEIAERMLGAIR